MKVSPGQMAADIMNALPDKMPVRDAIAMAQALALLELAEAIRGRPLL